MALIHLLLSTRLSVERTMLGTREVALIVLYTQSVNGAEQLRNRYQVLVVVIHISQFTRTNGKGTTPEREAGHTFKFICTALYVQVHLYRTVRS